MRDIQKSDIQNTAMQNMAMQNTAAQDPATQNPQNVQQDITKEKSDTIHNENTQHKDSLFVDLFYSDETARENLLSLYNALYGTSLTDPELVHRLKIDDVLYKNFKNDISFVMGGQVFVFGEPIRH